MPDDNFLQSHDHRKCDAVVNEQVVLLLIYLCVLFILARLIEVLVRNKQSQLSLRFLDPMTLSVLKLKALLEQRGVNHNSLVEKSEFSELVEASGAVTEEDLEAALMLQADDSTTPIIKFRGGTDFNQQLEDSMDSMWLVEVVSSSEHHDHTVATWRAIQRKLDKFGVRFGRFDCSRDTRYCRKKNWSTSKLVLALTEYYKGNAYWTNFTYQGPIQTEYIFNWVRQKLDLKIHNIRSYNTFQTDWLTYRCTVEPEVRAVVFSTSSTIPMFLSALSAKFPGRVKIGYVNTKTQQGKYLAQKANIDNSSSTYLIITAGRTFYYGYNPGEILNFQCMEFYLKTLYPSLNDMFTLSIIVTNTLGFFEISLTAGMLTTNIFRPCLCIFKFNVIHFLCWASFLKMYQLPIVVTFVPWAIRTIRFITGTFIFSIIRKDIFFYCIHWPLLLFSYLAYLILTRLIYKKMGSIRPSGAEQRTEASTQLSDSFLGLGNSIVDAPVYSQGENSFDAQYAYGRLDGEQQSSDRPNAEDEDSDPLDAEQQGSDQSVAEHDISWSVFFPVYGQERSATYGVRLSGGTSERPVISTVSPIMTLLYSQAANSFDLEERVPDGYIKLLKTWRYNPILPQEGFEDNDRCTICLEPFVAEEPLIGLPCLHSFHEKCIVPWLTEGTHSCPNCRRPSYKPNKLHMD